MPYSMKWASLRSTTSSVPRSVPRWGWLLSAKISAHHAPRKAQASGRERTIFPDNKAYMREGILQAANSKLKGAVLVALVLLPALTLAACGGDQRLERMTPILGKRVQVTVTLDGGTTLVVNHNLRMQPGMTAIDALEDVADVEFGPREMVSRVNGYSGGRIRPLGPEPSGWFYRVNGVEADTDAKKFKLKPGDSLWWDLRRYDMYESLPVAIGQFPQPFFSGYRDTMRRPQITYGKGMEPVAQEFEKLLEKADPEFRSIRDEEFLGRGGDGNGRPQFRAVASNRANIVIGRWEEIKRDPYIAEIAIDPRRFGLTVWIEGLDVRRQDPSEEFSTLLDEAEGVVWATTLDGTADGPLVLVITGLTDEGVRASARALRSGGFQYYLAGAVDREGKVIK